MNKNSEIKILVVDDDPDLIRITERLLKEKHYIVGTAVDGQECLQTIRLNKPDLLLLDVMLPDMSGIDICKTIKNDPQLLSIFVLLLSGLKTQSENISEGLETGADGYLIKPLQKREFLARVDAATRTIRAEKMLRESEERYRHISSKISDISYSCIINQNGSYSIDWMAGAAEQITGYSIEEIKAIQCWGKLVIDEDFDKFNQHVIGLTPGSSSACELRLRHKNGAIIWVTSFTECNNSQERLGHIKLFGALVDITERKQAEVSLFQTHLFLDSIIEQSPNSMWISDEHGTLIRLNQACRDNLQLKDDEVLGKYNIFKDNLLEEQGFMPMVKDVFEKGDTARFTIQYDTSAVKNLKLERTLTVFLDVHISPIVNSQGKVTNAIIQHIDITERKQAAMALKESETRFKSIINVSPVPMALNDKHQHITFLNPAFVQTFGYSLEDIPTLAHWWPNAYPDREYRQWVADAWQAGIEHVRRTGEAFTPLELTVRCKNGTSKTVLASASLFSKSFEGDHLVILYDITERKLVEKALIESEERFRLLAENSTDMISSHTMEGVYTYVSPACKVMLGYEPEELIGHSAYEFINSDDLAKIEQSRKMVIEEPETDVITYRLRRKEGSYIWVESTSHSIKDKKSDETIEIQISTRDITDRKHSEEALRESEIHYHKLFDQANEGLIMLTMDGKVAEVNQSFAEMHGYTVNDLKNMDMRDLDILSERSFDDRADILQRIQAGEVVRFEVEHYHKDGHIFPLSNTVSLINIDGQQLYLAFHQDITERKQAEAALRESEKKFRLTFDTSLDSIAITRIADGVIVSVNKEFLRMSGYTLEEVIGKTSSEINNWKDPEDRRKFVEEMQTRGEVRNYEAHLRTSIGEIYGLISASIFDLLGEPHVLSITRDITGRKQAENAIKEALIKAEAGNRLKTAFMNNISHEIRTPLNGILGFSSLIVQPDITDEEKVQFYSFIKTSSHRLLTTVTTYMDISMIASGTINVKRKPINLHQSLKQIFDQFHPSCTDKNIELHLEISVKTKNITLHSDEELLQKILLHILDNAIKFTNQGRITFGYAVQSGSCEFYVKDTGIGISKESLSLIFESFIQEELSSTRGHEGSGLGLSIAQGLVRLLGGEMRVESEKGIGSTFFFTIPHEGMKEAFLRPESEKSAVPVLDKPVILIAEDDESNRFYLEKILTIGSVKVFLATDGKEAVEQCRAHPEISLILMDLKMPVMDGFEATVAIKSFRKDLPIIALTAFAMSGDKKRALEAGCDDYIAKPFEIEVLLSKLKKYGLVV